MKSFKSALIGIGTNIGDTIQILERLWKRLEKHERLYLVSRSKIYKTEPRGGPSQPDFLNACAEIETELSATELLKLLHELEEKEGRKRLELNGPRTLDLDLLFYEDDVIYSAELKVPHPRMQERRFVLVPLNDIAPHFIHPALKKSISELLRTCVDTGKVEPL